MTRRSLIGTFALSALAQQSKKPNIIVIMADDMGFSDIGCYGSEIPTPNLDRLAANGVRLAQFYNAARCCPTRASLLTGLYPHQAGIGHMVAPAPDPAYQGYLNDRCTTIAEVMRQAGYRTAMAGKWHVGESRPHWPVDRGFERYFGLISGASSYFEMSKNRQMAMGNTPYTPPADGKFYMTNAFTDYALQFIDEFRGEPYFLYLAYTAPHWPLHALPEDIAMFRGKYRKGWDALRRERHAREVKLGIVDAKWKLTDRDTEVPAWEAEANPDDMDLRMAVYAAQIYRMDQNIGRLIAKLEETKQLDNTLILFLADNGGCAEEKIAGEKVGVAAGGADSYTSYGKPWANASNTPFRLYKHWVHEGGIASPLIAHWPARLKKKGHIDRTQTAHLIDIMATCIDAGGATYPANKTPLEGKSLLPVLEGKKRAGHPFLAWEHEGHRALRMGDWKIVAKHKGDWELYDMAADRTETRDLARAQPQRVRELAALYDGWAIKCGVLPWDKVQELRRQA
jgi:arylsulfatase